MMISLIKGIAVVLGALACALLVFEYLASRRRNADHATLLARLKPSSDTAISTRKTADQSFEVNGSSLFRTPHLTQSLRGRVPFIARAFERRQQKQLRVACCLELPKLFEIVALGMRVGLGFDQAFGLYVRGFDSALALACRDRFEVWERGLVTRESGLRDLAKVIECREFDRFVFMVLRALDYGAPLTHLLYDLAEDARKTYRAQRQEMVAKAPVKMLLPTGALILPAMMMLVIGPMVLDITERMV